MGALRTTHGGILDWSIAIGKCLTKTRP
jgi:hypothetical protein